MSRSVRMPQRRPLSRTTTSPMSLSRVAQAASMIVAFCASAVGFGVMTSRIFCFIAFLRWLGLWIELKPQATPALPFDRMLLRRPLARLLGQRLAGRSLPRPSRLGARRAACDRRGDGAERRPLFATSRAARRFVLLVVSFRGGFSLTPARRAFDRPIAMACLADRAPCFPSRTCSISSRTNSPAWVDGALPARRAFRARASISVPASHCPLRAELEIAMDIGEAMNLPSRGMSTRSRHVLNVVLRYGLYSISILVGVGSAEFLLGKHEATVSSLRARRSGPGWDRNLASAGASGCRS